MFGLLGHGIIRSMTSATSLPLRRVKIHLSLQHLASLLDLPDDIRAVSVYANADPAEAFVILESARFEPVLDGCETPIKSTRRVRTTDDEGNTWHRGVWGEDHAPIPA